MLTTLTPRLLLQPWALGGCMLDYFSAVTFGRGAVIQDLQARKGCGVCMPEGGVNASDS